jgi:uncharacterized protein (TIGR03086 family)
VHEIAARYRKVAGGFTERVVAVPVDGWDAPTPNPGWVARDVVDHLVEWIPAFFYGQWGLEQPTFPSAAEDPVAAWHSFDDHIASLLDDPELVGQERDLPMGRMSFEDAFAMIALSDVLIHTWDLARATGQDDTLDADEIARMVPGISPEVAAAMQSSGHYGPMVPVPPDASDQDKVLAFMGRTP